MNVVKNVPMCHTSGSKGSQPNNIQAYRLVLKSLQMNGCVKHQNMQMLVKLPPGTMVKWRPLQFSVRRHETDYLDCSFSSGSTEGCANHLKSRTGFYQIADPRARYSGYLDGVNYLCLVTSLMQACDELSIHIKRRRRAG